MPYDRLVELRYVYLTRSAGGWNRLPALYRWARQGGGVSAQREGVY